MLDQRPKNTGFNAKPISRQAEKQSASRPFEQLQLCSQRAEGIIEADPDEVRDRHCLARADLWISHIYQ